MERFVTDIEAARMLKVPLQELSSLEVHKCPYGYSLDVLEEFVARNNLPINEEIYHVIAIGDEASTHPELVWCTNIEEALFKANSRTKAILSESAFSKDVYDLAIIYGIKLVLIGGEQKICHVSYPSWQDAISCMDLL